MTKVRPLTPFDPAPSELPWHSILASCDERFKRAGITFERVEKGDIERVWRFGTEHILPDEPITR